MVTVTRVNEGEPIVPFDVNVDFEVNVSTRYESDVQTELVPNSPEWAALWDSYKADLENNIKTQDYWVTQDASRNATIELTYDPNREQLDENGNPIGTQRPYKAVVQFTINSATARVQARIDSELYDGPLDAYMSQVGAGLAQRFKDERNWINL